MQIIEQTTDFVLPAASAVAIGKFDGIHLGHRKLVSRLLEHRQNGLLATIFTFDTSAAAFFGGEEKELTTRAEKRAVFEEMGIDVLIEFPLNRETAATEPAEFVRRYLAEQMKAAYICAGPDVSFGKNGAGDYALLEQFADKYGYRAELIEKVGLPDGTEISSTAIREAVRRGDMELVRSMLGKPYSVSGRVEHGRRFGSTIGMPTANLIPEQDKLLPPNGVYYSNVIVMDGKEGKGYRGISNVGCKPTVSAAGLVGIETYLYDFEGDLYGKDITVMLQAFRRPEQKFDDADALRRQMEADIAAGREYTAAMSGAALRMER